MAKATTKKSTAKKSTTSTTKRADPFKTRKSRETERTKTGDTLTPPEEIQQAIDQFREAQEQMKHFEGEATIYKDQVMEYSRGEYAKRVVDGMNRSFKVMGEQSMVTFVVMDASAGLSEEDVEAFAERWGKDAADELITRDLASIRFDPEVLEKNYDAVVEALSVLPPKVFENLFKPMLMKAKPGAVEAGKRYAKTAEDLLELVQQLKIKNYIR